MSEADLILIDRGLSFGDVVKRNPSDAESGTVIRTSIKCDIQPIYPRFLGDQWPHAEEDNVLRGIPGSDITYVGDYQDGDYVVHKDEWLGVVDVAYEHITVRLENGSVVMVENPDELQQPEVDLKADHHSSLASILQKRLRHTNHAGADGDLSDVEVFYPGQEVTTKKGNLRRGQWVLGAYDPSISPEGTVVECRTRLLSMDWLSSNVFRPEGKPESDMPPVELDSGDYSSIRIYDKERPPENSEWPCGSAPGSDIAVGDILRLRDSAGAAIKYAGQHDPASGKQQPYFRRIPRSMTQGYDLNVFNVKKTETLITVQWQDGSITESLSSSFVPYLNVDDHEVWPGEIVVLKKEPKAIGNSTEATDEVPDSELGIIRPKEIGVVQSVNAKERLAKIRWFADPQVGIFHGSHSILVPGSYLGELTSKITEVSNYDIVAYPALSKRRGDLVLVAPTPEILELRSIDALKVVSRRLSVRSPEQYSSNIGLSGTLETKDSLEQNGSDFTDPDSNTTDIPTTDSLDSEPSYNWLGEVVDLNLDGSLSIRLGALDNVIDIKIPVERILTVVSDDDDISEFENPSSDEEDSGSSEEWTDEESVDFENAVETIEYEGGARQDTDGNDEMWTTDDDADGDFNGDDKEPPAKLSTEAVKPIRSNPLEPHPPLPQPTEVVFSTYPNMPPQFAILDDPPPIDHKYLSERVALSGALMRRVLKEHSILTSSLPNGIWVRTWADRLDLLRVLILGPQGTPYEFAPMIFDLHTSARFPTSPPEARFHSWTNEVGRINPNLYEDGKVCVSPASLNPFGGWCQLLSLRELIWSLTYLRS